MVLDYDFCGWATRNNVRCSDGRTIRHNAFVGNHGQTVPLVWNHDHNNPFNVLGHAMLENRDDGVFAYCKFNDTEAAHNAKELVMHGDVTALSIYANQLKQNGGDVIHGVIREVSLVLAGANPQAYIESVMSHGAISDDEAIIYTGEEFMLVHSDDEFVEEYLEDEVYDVDDEYVDEDDYEFEDYVDYVEDEEYADEDFEDEYYDEEYDDLHHADDDYEDFDAETYVEEVIDSMTDEQQDVLFALVGQALDEEPYEEDYDVKHNVFDNDFYEEDVISHSEMMAIFDDGKRTGSLKDAVLQHGIEDIEILFPDAHNLNTTPEFIKRDTGWVAKVMNGTHHTPFSRIKSVFADITEDEARAKGYLADHTHRDEKGNLVKANGQPAYKKEEVFSLLKRTTTPTTIYKKQKLDRDDVVDITDFDVVNWIKGEMRMMLDEEIARAILVGDGRSTSDDDKINEQNIRPIWKDEALFTIKKTVEYDPAKDTEETKAKAFIRAAIKARKDYKGTGNPTCFMTEDMLTECLLIEDGIGHRLYKTEAEVATALRAKEIVTVPVMEGLTRKEDSTDYELVAIFVNLSDYNVGADKGGSVNMFDDFDIDYNAQKYLIETRCSGALTKPYSAYVIEFTEKSE